MTALQPQAPDTLIESIIARTIRGLASPRSQATYRDRLRDYFRWHYGVYKNASILNADSVYAYRQWLIDSGRASATIHLSLTAIRKLAETALESNEAPQGWYEAIQRIPGYSRRGSASGNWLSLEKAKLLLAKPDVSSIEGMRNYTLIALMLAAGMRRGEVARLRVRQVAERNGWLCVVDFVGKGGKIGTVALPKGEITDTIRRYLEALRAFAKSEGFESADELPLIPSFSRNSKGLDRFMLANSLNQILERYTDEIAPHDLRRTFAGLAHKAGVDLPRISTALRHSSIATTQRYLETFTNLENPVAGVIGL